MMENPGSHDRMRSMLVIVATIATIVFNGLAAAGYINGVTPEIIAAKYPTLITPAAYAFSIWSLIYVGLIGFSLYQALPANISRLRPLRSLYIVTCVLNCAWIFFWHRDQVAMCFAIILLLLGVLLVIRIKLKELDSFAEIWALQAPFGLYCGWVTAAALVNCAVLLVSMGVKMSPPADAIIAVILILTAAAAAIIVRVKIWDFFYPLAIAWALTAIAVKQSGNTAIVISAALGVVICMVTTGSFVVNLKDSTSE
jgi:hypothetical protein